MVIPDFLSQELQAALRADVQSLRSSSKFKIARIGQDNTNQLNTDIRVAETCFIGPDKKRQQLPASPAREQLYEILDGVRRDLETQAQQPLDAALTELLYAYYPEGGYYRRHRDAVPGSASTLRRYSLLLYLNDNDESSNNAWDTDRDGGALRLHLDSGGDERPAEEAPHFVDVTPAGGTLVLLRSDAVPHEVLDTHRARVAVVGWYNRPVSVAGCGGTERQQRQSCSTGNARGGGRSRDGGCSGSAAAVLGESGKARTKSRKENVVFVSVVYF